jgi:hypothetical protein
METFFLGGDVQALTWGVPVMVSHGRLRTRKRLPRATAPWVCVQDWMCEEWITAKTGKTVAEHQQLTVESVLLLRALAPDLPIIPVIQGWSLPDYVACVALYAAHGIDLRAEPVVGLGSVCRRQATDEIHTIVSVLSAMGIRLHGFGVKTAAIEAVGGLVHSADSEAWSYGARRRIVH